MIGVGAMARALIATGVALLIISPSAATEVASWRPTPSELLAGKARGIAISAQGELFLAPHLTELERSFGSEKVLEIWSMALREDGSTLVGTGPEGRLFSIDKNGVGRRLFDAPDSSDSMITALLPLPGGELLIGTSPRGRIYRLQPDGRSELYAETGERYIWKLARSAGGNSYAATGPHGRLLRLRSDGSTDLFFDADEAHLVDLAPRPEGGWIVGGGGSGRVYFVDRDGNGWIAYDDELDEARAISPNGRGGWYVCLLASPAAPPRASEIRLRLPAAAPRQSTQAAQSTQPIPTTQSTPTNDAAVILGQISSLDQNRDNSAALRGRVIELDGEGSVTVHWESSGAVPLSSRLDSQQRLLIGTTEPAALYRLDPARTTTGRATVSRIATFDQGQISQLGALSNDADGVLVSASHPGAIYRLDSADAPQGQLDSAPFDAGAMARWGQISWVPTGRLGRSEFYTRTGNSPLPDESWSGWSAARVLAGGSPAELPDGRWAQWRLRIVGPQEPTATLMGIHWPFETINRPPQFAAPPVGPLVVKDEARFKFQLKDPDRDPLQLLLEHRTPLEADWQQLAPSVSVPYLQNSSSELTWDLSTWTDGEYDVRFVVSDAAGNHPGEQFEVRSRRERLRIDRRPPTITTARLQSGDWEVVAHDAKGQISHLELRLEDRVVARLRPVDGICDSARERFQFPSAEEESSWTLRAYDAAGNETTEALVAKPSSD